MSWVSSSLSKCICLGNLTNTNTRTHSNPIKLWWTVIVVLFFAPLNQFGLSITARNDSEAHGDSWKRFHWRVRHCLRFHRHSLKGAQQLIGLKMFDVIYKCSNCANVWAESHLHGITKTRVHINEHTHANIHRIHVYRICWLNLHSACCVIDAFATEIRKEGRVNQHLLCAIKTETQLQPELPLQFFM